MCICVYACACIQCAYEQLNPNFLGFSTIKLLYKDAMKYVVN